MTLGPQFDSPQVFHGTAASLKPGDLIHPNVDKTWKTKAAFGTVWPETAADYAADSSLAAGQLFGSVYEVTPESQLEAHPIDQKRHELAVAAHGEGAGSPPEPGNMPIDRAGFRVKRHHAFVSHYALTGGDWHTVTETR